MAARPARRLTPAGRTVRAELTKLWTLAGARWLVAATIAALVVVGAAVAATLDVRTCRGGTCSLDPVRSSLGGVWIAQVPAAVLGVLAISSEYDPAQIRVTLAAVPRRIEVLAAKLAVVTALVAGAATVGTLGALAAGRAVLTRSGVAAAGGGLALAEGPTVRAAVGTVCYLALVAVLALGLATMLRDAALAVTATLALLYLFPLLAAVVTQPVWRDRLHRWAPMDAGLAVQATRNLDQLAIGPWAGLAVLAAYTAAGVIAGAALFRLRDP